MLHKEKNPYLSQDAQLEMSARKAADVLWEATGGELSSGPEGYLKSLKFSYSDGTESRLYELNKVDFSEDSTYEDFTKVVSSLVRVNPIEWPNPEFTEEIQSSKLLHNLEPELDFSENEFIFAEGEDISDKAELFLKKIISSVYLDGITKVTDRNGNPPNASNNYLLSPDDESFTGIFYDSPPDGSAKKFPFKISKKPDGKFLIEY
jgi:hypothetical protein